MIQGLIVGTSVFLQINPISYAIMDTAMKQNDFSVLFFCTLHGCNNSSCTPEGALTVSLTSHRKTVKGQVY